MHKKCTNKNCPFDHDILSSARNRAIIKARGVNFLPASTLHELARASADPNRSVKKNLFDTHAYKKRERIRPQIGPLTLKNFRSRNDL